LNIYHPFIETLKRYQHGEIALERLVENVEGLMAPYPELLVGFKQFIPTVTGVFLVIIINLERCSFAFRRSPGRRR